MALIFILLKAETTYEEVCVAGRRSSRADAKRQKSTHSKSEKRNNLFFLGYTFVLEKNHKMH